MIKEEWLKLEEVLPGDKSEFEIGEPATDAEIEKMEAEIGFRVPEIAELLRVRNGMDGFDWRWYLFDSERLIGDRNVMLGLMNKFKDETFNHDAGIKSGFWNPKWVQFATDGGGNLYCVDYDPAPEGKLGQIIFWDHETTASVEAPDLEQWLVQEREAILRGDEDEPEDELENEPEEEPERE